LLPLLTVIATMVGTVILVYIIIKFVFGVNAGHMLILTLLASFLVLALGMGFNLVFELSTAQLIGIIMVLAVVMAMAISMREGIGSARVKKREEGKEPLSESGLVKSTESVEEKGVGKRHIKSVVKKERGREDRQGWERTTLLGRVLHSKDLNNLLKEAYSQIEKGNYVSAVSLLELAVKNAKGSDATALLEAEIGRINLVLGEEDKTIEHLTKAQDICKKSGNKLLGEETGAVLKKIASPLYKKA